MKASSLFSPKAFYSGELNFDSSIVIFSPQWRLQLDTFSLSCAFDFPDIVFTNPLIGFDVLLLWQLGLIALEHVEHQDLANLRLVLQPLGIQPSLYGDQFQCLFSSTKNFDFSIYSENSRVGKDLSILASEVLQELDSIPVFKALLYLRSLAHILPLVEPLLELNSINRLSFLSKYAFCRTSRFQAISEQLFSTALPSTSDLIPKCVDNVSPSLRRGETASLSQVQDLVRAVFRKTRRGLIPLTPPIPTYYRSTPSPGAFASCEAFILHGLPDSPSSLLFYDSLADSFVDCLLDTAPCLHSLARLAHLEAILNCQSDEWVSTVIVFASDLWTLEYKYGPGAFSLASFEVGVLAEAVHQRLPQHQLAGCLCGSMQIWPLLALAFQERKLLPMLGYSIVQI